LAQMMMRKMTLKLKRNLQSKLQNKLRQQKDKLTRTLRNVQSIWLRKKLKKKEVFLMACLVLMMMRNKNLLKILLKLKQHQLKTQMTPKLRAQMTQMNLQQTILIVKKRKVILMMLLQTILIVKMRKIADSLVVYLTQLKKL